MKTIKYTARSPRRPGLKKEFGSVSYTGTGKYTCSIRIPKWIASITGLRQGQKVKVLGFDDRNKTSVKLLLEVYL